MHKKARVSEVICMCKLAKRCISNVVDLSPQHFYICLNTHCSVDYSTIQMVQMY